MLVLEALLEEILGLTKEQGVSLKNEDLNRFRAILLRKEVVIERIDQQLKENSGLKETVDKELIKAIKEQDERNRIEFERQYEEAKAKVRQGRVMEQKSTAYTNPYTSYQERGMFFDRKHI